MRLGLDLDGVIFDFVGAARRTFPSIPKDPDKVDLTEYLNTQQQEQFYKFLDSPLVFGNLPLLPGMDKLIPYFNSQETYIITSRNMNVHDATKRQVAQIGLRPVEILFRRNKTKAVRDYNIDVFIDDQVKHVEPLPKDQIALMPEVGYNKEFIKRAQDEDRMVFPYHGAEELRDFLIKLEGATHGGRNKR